jgi:hypothetical protein
MLWLMSPMRCFATKPAKPRSYLHHAALHTRRVKCGPAGSRCRSPDWHLPREWDESVVGACQLPRRRCESKRIPGSCTPA